MGLQEFEWDNLKLFDCYNIFTMATPGHLDLIFHVIALRAESSTRSPVVSEAQPWVKIESETLSAVSATDPREKVSLRQASIVVNLNFLGPFFIIITAFKPISRLVACQLI